MKLIIVLLLSIAFAACATQRFSKTQLAQIDQVIEQEFDRAKRGEHKGLEAVEIAIAARLSKLYEFTETDYELFATKIDVGRRYDRKEVTIDQAIFLVQLKQNEINQRQAARRERGINQMAAGLAILAAANSPPQQYTAPAQPPTICSSYVNGRYISTRCW